jgi:hypothetical protein
MTASSPFIRAISSEVGDIERRLRALQSGIEKLGARASSRTKPPSGPQSRCLGRTDKPKVKSRASSSCGAKCTAVAISICFRPD